MAVAFDAASSAAGAGDVPLTFSHTCSGSDRVLLVWVGVREGAPPTVTSITYNGVNLTRVGGDSNDPLIDLWRLIAPATGANNVVITLSANVAVFTGIAISFTGAHQTTPLGTAVFEFAGDQSIAVSSATDELVCDALFVANDGTATVGAGQTERINATGGEGLRRCCSTEPGATTVTMSWTGVAETATQGGVSVKPAAEAGGTTWPGWQSAAGWF